MGDSVGDAKMGIMHVLKPYVGFEARYQGIAADRWIMLQEGPALDANAGHPGYPAGLVAGLPVVMGSRISLWLPHIGTVTNPVQTYRWSWMFRLRNLQEYQTGRGAYHAATILGQRDTLAGQDRVLKPAGYRCFSVQQAEPAATPVFGVVARQQFNVRAVDARPYSGNPSALPINADGTPGIIQSGVLDPNVFGAAAAFPTYDIVHDICDGDELLLAISRDVAPNANYDFAVGQADFRLSNMMSSPAVGALVFTGSTPSGQSSFA